MKSLQESLLDVGNTMSKTEHLFDVETAIKEFGNYDYFSSSATFDICNNWGEHKNISEKDAEALIENYFGEYDEDYNVYVQGTHENHPHPVIIPFQTMRSLIQYVASNVNEYFISFLDNQELYPKIVDLFDNESVHAHYTYLSKNKKEIENIADIFPANIAKEILKANYVKVQDYLDEGLFYVAYSGAKRSKFMDCVFSKIFEDGESNTEVASALKR